MGFEISSEQLNKLNAYLQDGKIDAEEAKEVFGRTLSEKELQQVNQQLQQQLGGVPNAPVDDFSYNVVLPNVEVKQSKPENAIEQKPKNKAATVGIAFAACTAIGATIGAIGGAFFGGAGAVPGAALGAKLGAGVGVVLGLYSCTPGSVNYTDESDYYYNNLNLTVNSQNSSSQEIAQAIYQVFAGRLDKLEAILEANGIKLDKMNQEIGDIEQYLAAIEVLVKDVLAEQGKSNAWFEKLFLKLSSVGDDVEFIKSLLGKMDVDMSTVIELLKDSNENEEKILAAISNGNANTEELLQRILDKVKEGNKIGANNSVILNQILNKLKNISPQDNADVVALLEKILAQVTANVEAIQDMDKTTQENFAKVIALLDKVKPGKDDEILAILEKILAQDVQNGKDNQVNFTKVIELLTDINNGEKLNGKKLDTLIELIKQGNISINLIKQLIENNQVDFEELKALIIQNNELAAQTNEWMAKLDDNQKEIIELLKNFKPSGEPTDLTEITNLLKNINDNVIKNGDTQTQILEKIEVLSLAVNQLVDVVGDNNKALLLQILNKIPHACECKPVDISEVIKILIEIKEKIEGGNHEGILEDLDEYFN